MATLNSDDKRGSRPAVWKATALACALLLPGNALSDADGALTPAARARQEYAAAAARLAASPTNSVAGWEFARACFDLAEFATNATQRAEIAEQGIAASRNVLEQDPNSVGGNYYLAMNLGQLARTKLLGALKLVGEMETLFLRVAELDPGFDEAGPHRSLGLLYRDAPGWPASIGSRKKARFHLERAVELRPDHPENRLVLLESQLKWGLEKEARKAVADSADALRRARARLVGDEWMAVWIDWDRRWLELLAALKVAPSQAFGEAAP